MILFVKVLRSDLCVNCSQLMEFQSSQRKLVRTNNIRNLKSDSDQVYDKDTLKRNSQRYKKRIHQGRSIKHQAQL